MLEEALGVVIVVLVAGAVARGAVSVALGGFFAIGLGALIAATCLSILGSSAAAVTLTAISDLPSTSTAVIVLRGVLVALAQPTMSGVAMLATVIVLSYGIAKASLLALDIRILFDSHAECLQQVDK